ncbi:MAG: hypothetical protein Kilf2KO_08370 [Rhodospirillales bacterium]
MTSKAEQRGAGRAGRGLSIRVVMTLVAVALVAISGGFVLAFLYNTSSGIAKNLVKEKAEIVNQTIVARVRSHLEPVEAQAAFTAAILSQHAVGRDGSKEIGILLYTALAAAPQVSSLALVTPDHRLVRAFRNRPATEVLTSDWSDDQGFVAMMNRAWTQTTPYWGPLFHAETSDETFLNYLTPLRDRDDRHYVLISSVSLNALSRFIRSLQDDSVGTPFILSDGKAVLAHALLAEGYPGLTDRQPLPALADFQDSVLARMWSPERLSKIEADLVDGLEARVLSLDEETYVFLFQQRRMFGESAWYIGSYFTLDSMAAHLGQNRLMIAGGLGVILVAVLIALLLSRAISRPIREVAVAADRINRWEIETPLPLSRSLFKEVNEANDALGSAIRGLKSLQVYIPRKLARRLVEGSQSAAVQSEERLITVLFTDIVGFTRMAEAMEPKAVLEMLNGHFTLLASCIQAEQGTVDKFIGDAAMAFWGGLDNDRHHATHACRAALGIMQAIQHDNDKRRAAGLDPIALCIGIHSGPAMVGNIGSPGRVNYTVIGDTVNTAQRLEGLGRDVRAAGQDSVCLISGRTAALLDPEIESRRIGRTVLHGRHQETDVFRLVAGPCGESSAEAQPIGEEA